MENGRPHWTSRPGVMVPVVLAANFIICLAVLGVSLLVDFSAMTPEAVLAILPVLSGSYALTTIALGALFYFLIRCMQRKHGTPEPVSWRPGAGLWLGIPPMLLLLVFYFLGSYQDDLLTGVSSFLYAAATSLVLALSFALLFPAAERRFGALKGALLLSVSFALLAVLEQAARSAWSGLFADRLASGVDWALIGRQAASAAIDAFITTAAFSMLRCALYFAASKRLPGTWILFASVPELLTLLFGIFTASIPRGSWLSGWMLMFCIRFPYYLLVFAMSLGVVAGYQKWRTYGAFKSALLELLRKARTTQEDLPD